MNKQDEYKVNTYNEKTPWPPKTNKQNKETPQKKILSFVAKCVEQEDIMFNQINQTQKDNYDSPP